MPTGDGSQTARVKRRRGLVLTNFKTTNPNKPIGGPSGTDQQTLLAQRNGLGLFYVNNIAQAEGNPIVAPGPSPPSPSQLWIAAGRNAADGVLLTSPDLSSNIWTPRVVSAFSGGEINAVAYGGGKLVAVGKVQLGGVISTSTDGVTWSPSKIPLSISLIMTGIAYGNNMWVAVGLPAGVILTSDDGNTWISRTTDAFNAGGVAGVIYTGSTWVAYGTGFDGSNKIVRSTDGITWTSSDISGYGGILSGVTYNTSSTIAFGEFLIKSEDGSTWEAISFPHNITGMANNNSEWVFVARDNNGDNYIATSDDDLVRYIVGTTTIFNGGNPKGATYYDSDWVIYGSNAIFATSSDRDTWSVAQPLAQFAGGNLNTIIHT